MDKRLKSTFTCRNFARRNGQVRQEIEIYFLHSVLFRFELPSERKELPTWLEVSIRTDSKKYKITFLTYFCMLNRFKVISDDKGFVLKEIQEMKWRDTLQCTASKERRISKKMERDERGRTTTMRMGMKELRKPKIYLASTSFITFV